jgi:hypothetical protein
MNKYDRIALEYVQDGEKSVQVSVFVWRVCVYARVVTVYS